jgi:hypothetical protein
VLNIAQHTCWRLWYVGVWTAGAALLLYLLSNTSLLVPAAAAGGNAMWRLDSAPGTSDLGQLGGGSGGLAPKPRSLAPVDHIALDPCYPSRMALVLQVCSMALWYCPAMMYSTLGTLGSKFHTLAGAEVLFQQVT